MKTTLISILLLCSVLLQAQVYTGNLTLASQAEVNAFSYKEVTGTLRIEGSDISNLTPLVSLTSVGRGLYIENNLTLISLSGLGNLTSVGGDLFLIGNPTLTGLSGLENLNTIGENLSFRGNDIFANLVGIENLTSVGGYLSLYNNDALTSLSGLENLTSVGGYLSVHDNAVLSSLSGLENLTSVGRYLLISSNPALTSLSGLDNLTSVPEGLSIEYNTLLTSLSGLGNITSVDQGLVIQYNDALSDLASLSSITSVGWQLSINNNTVLTSLAGLENITSVGWSLLINDNAALTSLVGLENLTSIGRYLIIQNNSTLTSLTGLDNVTSVGWDLDILNNDVLSSFCALYELINANGLIGNYKVDGNAVNPTKQEIIDNGPCSSNTPPIAVCQNVTVPANENCQAMVTAAEVNNGSTDPEGDEISLSISPEGPYGIGVTNVTLTVDDGNGETATCEATVTVYDDIPPTVVTHDLTVQLDENGFANIVPADINNGSSDNCDIESYKLDIMDFDCGDIASNPIEVTLTVTDIYGNSASNTANVTVKDEIAPVVETQDIIVQLDENGLASIVPADIDNGSNDACGIASLSVIPNAFTCANVGNNIVTLIVTDVNGNSDSKTANVTVRNDSPVIDAVTTSSLDPMQLGTPATITVNFTDDNATEVNIQWGDFLEDDYTTSTGVVNATHNYLLPGVYTVTVTVTDPCGEMTVFDYQYIVIYDPTAGFVTGGGWIFSPEGAYKPDPLLTGKASFGFVSKYKKGSSVPDGNTEFQFKAGNLNCNSTDYEWLVIAGSKAMFKGSGTINGFGNYGFMLSAIDADLTPSGVIDKFRIKIWDKDNGDVVVYDNNLEVDDNADPTTKIGGGSIIIHKSKTKSAEIESDILLYGEASSLLVYPNPFSDRLQFEFESPVDGHARIDLFDFSGRILQTVFNSPVEGGVHYNAEFIPASENSGIIYYRMTLGMEVFNGKVVFNK